jgi:DNA-binding CsgD family transcriptional regulator
MASDLRERSVDKIARLAAEPRDLAAFWRECTDVISAVVPYYWTPCWYTLDPASLLITSHYHDGLLEFPAEWLVHEYYEDDVNKIVDVALSETGVGTLHEATGGDPASSPRWHLNRTLGGDQELLVRLRSSTGDVWGLLGLYREPGQALFDDADKRFLRAVAPDLAEGARRALLVGEATDPDWSEADGYNPPGLVVLGADGRLESFTPGTERWLGELPDGDAVAGLLPSALRALAGRVLRLAEDPARPAGPALSRVLSRSGVWLALHGAVLTTSGRRLVAVIIEPASPARIHPLLMAAYRLTERERDVTRLVLRGVSTERIAEELVVSGHTVQQHLKSVFEKTGVHSRRDLVGRIFFTHYEPRFRDNEHRVGQGRPMRGGPAPRSERPPAD